MTITEARTVLEALAVSIEDPMAYYEGEAERFYAASGLMAPGKSAPPGFYTEADEARRMAAWSAWCESRRASTVLAVRAVLAELE